jgi:3-oxoacyl-[acyl-carrier-protein] synthase II
MGEGAAVFVLETLQHAKQRGAAILAEVLGYAMTCEAWHMSSPKPDGRALRAAMQGALDDAEVAPSAIDYISPHASGTQLNDINELHHIRSVFGPHASTLAISGTKPYTGHALGAAAALELATCLLAMQYDWLPPTLHLDQIDAEATDLNLVPNTPQQRRLRYILSNSFGFGGIDTALVLGPRP